MRIVAFTLLGCMFHCHHHFGFGKEAAISDNLADAANGGHTNHHPPIELGDAVHVDNVLGTPMASQHDDNAYIKFDDLAAH